MDWLRRDGQESKSHDPEKHAFKQRQQIREGELYKLEAAAQVRRYEATGEFGKRYDDPPR
jgi:hypothetical protein